MTENKTYHERIREHLKNFLRDDEDDEDIFGARHHASKAMEHHNEYIKNRSNKFHKYMRDIHHAAMNSHIERHVTGENRYTPSHKKMREILSRTNVHMGHYDNSRGYDLTPSARAHLGSLKTIADEVKGKPKHEFD